MHKKWFGDDLACPLFAFSRSLEVTIHLTHKNVALAFFQFIEHYNSQAFGVFIFQKVVEAFE